MNTDTALSLLGPLASQAIQRRYLVGGTKDTYLLAEEALNDGDYFLHHPELGATQSLRTVQEFARALQECAQNISFDEAAVANETLVERDPDWARIRDAAKAVLLEMGADLGAWEHAELEGDDAVADEPRFSSENIDPRQIVGALTAVRNRPPPRNFSSTGCIGVMVATVAIVGFLVVAPSTALSSIALWGVGAILGLTLLGSGVLAMLGSAFFRGAVAADADEAIDELVAAYPNGDPAILRQAAVRILDQSTVSTGPVTVGTFDCGEAAERLGDALSYVLQVERILLERKEIYPCFTMLEPASGDPELDWPPIEDES